MAGAHTPIHIGIKVHDEAVRQQLQSLQRLGNNARGLMHRLGERLKDSTQERFNTQTAPGGQEWQQLNPIYKAAKHKNSDKILTLRGQLRSSIRYQVKGGDTVAIGTNLEYAAMHQFGGSIKPRAGKALRAGSRGNGVWRKMVKTPARPYLGISKQDSALIQRITNGWVKAQAEA